MVCGEVLRLGGGWCGLRALSCIQQNANQKEPFLSWHTCSGPLGTIPEAGYLPVRT